MNVITRLTGKQPPDRILVAWCPKCGEPQSSARPDEKATIKGVCSFCPGSVPLATVRYQLAQRRIF